MTIAGASLSQHRLPVLDGLRGLAILLVMEFHFWGLLPGIVGLSSTRFVDVQLLGLFRIGWSGVDLFFVLSGFLITSNLYDARSSGSYFSSFYARRFLRIFPLYYLFLAVMLFVLPHLPSLGRNLHLDALEKVQVFYWTYTVNVARALRTLGPEMPLAHSQFWSLAVEEQFYLVWPTIVLLLAGRRRLMTFCGVLVLAAFALRCMLLVYDGFQVFDGSAGYVLMPCRIDALAVGAFIALVLRGEAATIERLRRAAPFVGGASLAVIVGLYMTYERFFPTETLVETVGFSALACFYGALLVLAIHSRPEGLLHRVFANPILRTLGKYSYALYIFHLAVAFQMIAHVGGQWWTGPVAGSYLVTNVIFSTFATAVSLALSWLSWHLLENPVLGLKRYFPYFDEAGR